jgi:hypothetical protein
MTSQLKVDRISPATGSEITIDGFGGDEGSIIQTVLGTCSVHMTTGSGDYVVTGLEATITPTKTSSKILVTWNIQGCSLDNGAFSPGLSRNGVVVYSVDNPIASYGYGISNLYWYQGPFILLDEPNTTSACKYETLVKTQGGLLGLNGKDVDYPTETQILLQEIAG